MAIAIRRPAVPFGQVVTVAKSGGMFTDLAVAAASIIGASATNPYTILVYPGQYTVGSGAGDYIDLSKAGANDYVSLIGVGRGACQILRPASPGIGNAVIQSAKHSTISSLTINSNVSRHIHWDQGQDSTLDVYDLECIGQINLSLGATGGNFVTVQNCYFRDGGGSCHGGAVGDGNPVRMNLSGNVWGAYGASFGIDLATAAHDTIVQILGNNSPYIAPDPGGGFGLVMPTDTTKRVYIHTDGSLGRLQLTPASPDLAHNAMIYPQYLNGYVCDTGVNEGDVVVYDFATKKVKTVTTKNSPFPAVVVLPATGGTGTWSPRLSNAPMASVQVVTADAVALGDILVTSTTTGKATTDNAQTDLTRILGWAESAKTAAVAGRVNARLNQVLRF